jgi:hypothetical protein
MHVFGLRDGRADEEEGRRANKLEDFLELTLSIRSAAAAAAGKSLGSSPGFLSAAQPLNYGIIYKQPANKTKRRPILIAFADALALEREESAELAGCA